MIIKVAALAAGVFAFATTALADGNTLKIVNSSGKTIYHLYMSDSSDNHWGPDQLGNSESDTIEPGGTFTLTDIDSGSYDIKLATKGGTECEVDDVEFDADYRWTVTNDMLSDC